MLLHLKLGILIFIFSTSLFEIAHSCARRRRSRSCRAVNGGWSGWSSVNHCSCNGKARQVRHCNNPRPSCGGRSCSGRSTQYVNCNECSCNKGGCQHICEETSAGRSCSCFAGYRLSGTSCIEIRCATKDWKTPLNGVKRPQKCSDGKTVSMNTMCTVECKSGYELEGPSTAVCTSQGNWNPGSPPRCTDFAYTSIISTNGKEDVSVKRMQVVSPDVLFARSCSARTESRFAWSMKSFRRKIENNSFGVTAEYPATSSALLKRAGCAQSGGVSYVAGYTVRGTLRKKNPTGGVS